MEKKDYANLVGSYASSCIILCQFFAGDHRLNEELYQVMEKYNKPYDYYCLMDLVPHVPFEFFENERKTLENTCKKVIFNEIVVADAINIFQKIKDTVSSYM